MLEQSPALLGALRAKEFLWLATQPAISILLSLAGKSSKFDRAGVWWAALPAEKRPPEANKEFYDRLTGIWNDTYGDSRNELVFIGENFDEQLLNKGLTAPLLTLKELAHPKSWQQFEDSFPP